MPLPPPPLLGALPAHPGLADSIMYQLTGLIVVFTVLGLIWFTLELTGAFFKRRQAAEAARLAAAPAPVADLGAVPAPAAATDGSLAPELVAVIAAAVHLALDGRAHRIAAITPAPSGAAWAAEGRREIFSSHRVR